MGTSVNTSAGYQGMSATSTVSSAVEIPTSASILFPASAGTSPRTAVDYGSNTIRVTFVQQSQSYGVPSIFTFTNLNPTPPAGCTGTPQVTGITVQTNKPGAGFVVSGATFGPHSVSVPYAQAPSTTWQPGEFFLVTLQFGCPGGTTTGGFDPCCPPFNSQQLQSMFAYQGTGGIASPYRLHYMPPAAFNNQMNAYFNYLQSLSLGFNSISVTFILQDGGIGTTAGPFTTIATQPPVTWNGSGTPTPPSFFGNLLQVNHWYRLVGNVTLNGGPGTGYLPANCRTAYVDVRLQVLPSPLVAAGHGQSGAAPATLQIRLPDGTVMDRPLAASGSAQ